MVFNDPGWKYFCQFVNLNGNILKKCDPEKIYVSLKKDYLYEGANHVNPFCFTVGITDLAVYNCKSYNMEVSTALVYYIKDRVERNSNDININDFISFMDSYVYDDTNREEIIIK